MSQPVNLGKHAAPKHYVVHSIFKTIQGEGAHAGASAVFVRFSGCNVWSGFTKTRYRDSQQNSACAAFCDTNFLGVDEENGGGRFLKQELAHRVKEAAGPTDGISYGPLLVLTGGEPGLQLDQDLVDTIAGSTFPIHVETNGTASLPKWGLRWITWSPKPPMVTMLHLLRVNEVKLLSVYIDDFLKSLDYHALLRRDPLPLFYVQPVDFGDRDKNQKEIKKCLDFVSANPMWKLSVQIHKVLGLE